MIWKLGHRGACGHAPENTPASMKKALELGVHGFEFDIRMSRDGEPVVIHDATLDRTTDGKGHVGNYTLAELQKFNAGNGEKIPSLRNVLDLVDKRCRLFIELKDAAATTPVAEILKIYIEDFGWTYEQLYICSFDHLQIATLRKFDANFRTGALIAGIPVTLSQIAAEAGAWSINPSVHHLNKALVDDAHQRKLKVLTWTANDAGDIERAKGLGVDGIFSDFPERI